jgi:guanylate kinase
MSSPGGKLVVISGPSGAGKTSVCKALRLRPRVEFSVSATTRSMRPREQDGVDYHFMTAAEFQRHIAAGDFVEHARYNDNLYGTLRQPMEAALRAGRTFVLEIEVQGTRQLRAAKVPGLYVFIVPPSLAVLRERLERRGTDSAAEIDKRLAIAEAELKAAALYDHVVTNQDLQQTIASVVELIER